MTEDSQQPGGIRAKKIQADNIVSGVQIQGGDPQQAIALITLAQAIRRGEINADEINARQLVSGLQYIADPAQASPQDLYKELVALCTKVDAAIAAQEIPDEADAEDTKESLEAAMQELAKAQPNGKRVLRRLDEANTILTKSAEMAQSAGKIGALVIHLAPVAATLWQIAQRLFGL